MTDVNTKKIMSMLMFYILKEIDNECKWSVDDLFPFQTQ